MDYIQEMRIKIQQLENYITALEMQTNKIQQLEKELKEADKANTRLRESNFYLQKENAELKVSIDKIKNATFECDTCLDVCYQNEKLEKQVEDLKLQRDGQSISITELQLNLVTRDRTIEDLDSKLANQKYLDRQEVENIVKIYIAPEHTFTIRQLTNQIFELAYDRNKLTAILVGKILETDKDAVKIADEIIKELGGSVE